MSKLGNSAENQAFTPIIDTFNGNGATTAFTLTYPVASVAQVEAYISNVPQQPGVAYTVLGNTITFTSAPPSGTANIYVRYTSPITQIMQPGQGTVGTAQMMDAAVTAAKIASGQVLPAAGIAFPATQSASSDANTLDDYEEGTWTPNLQGAASVTYTFQSGRYIKVGRNVTLQGVISWSAFTASGNLALGGVPFNPDTSVAWTNGLAIGVNNSTSYTQCYQYSTSTTFFFYTAAGSLGGTASANPFGSSGSITIYGTYMTA